MFRRLKKTLAAALFGAALLAAPAAQAECQGSNLLDQAYNDYHSVPQLPRDIRRYDRVVGLSLRWRN